MGSRRRRDEAVQSGPREATSAITEAIHGNVLLRTALQRAREDPGLMAQRTAHALGKSRKFFDPDRVT